MESQFVYDNQSKHLHLAFKEKFRTEDGLTLKVAGSIDTVTAKASCRGSLFKHVFLGRRPISRKATEQKDLRTRLGAGVYADLDQADVRAAANLTQYVALGSRDAYIKAVGQAEYNTNTNKKYGTGKLQLTKAFYGFTSDQDVKLSVGYKGTMDDRGRVTGEAFGEVRENNWRLQTNFKGKWLAMYDL